MFKGGSKVNPRINVPTLPWQWECLCIRGFGYLEKTTLPGTPVRAVQCQLPNRVPSVAASIL